MYQSVSYDDVLLSAVRIRSEGRVDMSSAVQYQKVASDGERGDLRESPGAC